MVRIRSKDMPAFDSPNNSREVNGRKNRKQGDEFERELESDFLGYWSGGVAMLAKMPVPSRMAFVNGRTQLVKIGTAPFDYYGMMLHDARFVAMEAKSTSTDQKSMIVRLPKISANGKISESDQGGGLKYHQLEALARVAEHGGVARVVWNLMGQVLVLKEAAIINAYDDAASAWAIKQRGERSPYGLCSIDATEFSVAKRADYGDWTVQHDWLTRGA